MESELTFEELSHIQSAQLAGIRLELRALRLMLKAERTADEQTALEEAERDADRIATLFEDESPASCGMA